MFFFVVVFYTEFNINMDALVKGWCVVVQEKKTSNQQQKEKKGNYRTTLKESQHKQTVSWVIFTYFSKHNSFTAEI